ncbi:AsmA family protein [Herbaspirillum sp. NPDC087042]|uniref:AsmA family protein n=1 Tax=Herbaspirillum sp. NPDC087042 TaxID=3364004 RepID=UPI0037F12929
MPRLTTTLLWLLASLLAVIAAAIIFILSFDWNRARPWINDRVSTAIGREFVIQGDLSLHWQRPEATVPPAGFWARWLPWPRLQAEDLRLGNPEAFAQSGPMATVRRVTFTLNPLPLLVHKISLPSLEVQDPSVSLQRNREAVNNWTFKTSSDGPSDWQLQLGRIALRQGKLGLDDAVDKINIKAAIDTLDPDREKLYGLGWKLDGSFNGAPVSGQGKAGGVLSLQDPQQPYPLQAEVKVGKTAIGVRGTLTKPAELAALDLRLSVSGASMGNLYPLTGVLLPETPPFATEGRLIGKIDAGHSEWNYEQFSGKVGQSDIHGDLRYATGGGATRPSLSGTLTSNELRFDDLAPLIGADSNAQKAERGAQERQPVDKILPVKTFGTDAWGALDADVRLAGKRIIKQKDLPINDLQAHLILKDKVLTLAPLDFGVAGGTLTSTIRLDGQAAQMKSEISLSARKLKIQKLYPQLDASRTSFGEINGDARLSATGNSVAAMLGSANGEVKTLVTQGAISKFLLEAAGLNVGNVVISKLFGDKEVQLNCLAGDLPVRNGVMEVKTLLLDTEDALIVVDGSIDMKQEKLDLNVHPKSKGLRIISLRSPLYVSGTFKNPDVGVNKGVLALRAGGAVALGLLAPVTAILPLINIDRDQQADCAHLLDEARKAPQAPPSGKTHHDHPTPKK